MIKEKFDKLPEFIREQYEQEITVSQPIKALEHIVLTARKAGVSDVHLTGVPYDEGNLDNLVSVKFRIDSDLDNFIYNISEEVREDPKSYISMNKYAEFIRAIKNSFEIGEYNETEIPQDAAYKFEHFDSAGLKTGETKIRANFIPMGIDIIGDGNIGVHQSLVMRIIDDSIDGLPKYDDLGIMPTDKIMLDRFLKSQKGALINSGPTGSGKSVSMQVLLSQIASEDKKIHTLEDPIEYRNPLLVQTQIKASKGFTWDVGIRALMRQDPDIIMVGEVRDEESAELFIESSLTGHMGFTTTHAKTGCGAFDRLKLMGVKPYIIVGGVSISMSQRLSQKLCPDCRIKVTDKANKEKLGAIWNEKYGDFDFTKLTPEDICMMLGDDKTKKNLSSLQNLFNQFKGLKLKIKSASSQNEKDKIKQEIISLNNDLGYSLKDFFKDNHYTRKIAVEGEKFCERCNGNGVKGRVGIFEFIETTKEIEQLVLDDVPLKHMESYVRENNVLTLDRYGIMRTMRGDIDMQELLKLL